MPTHLDNQNNEVRLSIKYVRQVFYNVNERLLSSEDNKTVLVSFAALLSHVLDRDLINFRLKAWYHYENSKDVELATIEVENIFTVENLSRFANNGELVLPASLSTTVVSLAISHTRALFTHNLASTDLQIVTIPIVKPSEIARQLLPKSFEEKVKDVLEMPE